MRDLIANCRIAQMLRRQKKHISFHTPGHKRAGADITELSYSDNLLSPHGVIKKAQEEIAQILGAEKSFLLTDGSTSGVYAILWALKEHGCRMVAASAYSHPCVKNGCRIAGLELIETELSEAALEEAVKRADALLLTSPDYYGNFPPLKAARAICDRAHKPLVIDGAHGSHLHFSETYASRFADMWVDGAHKSLPALTQGAVVSAKDGHFAELLGESVKLFRTSSPSYPVLASVEYAVKYPRNEKIERAAAAFKKEYGAYPNADWSKILIPFGNKCGEAQRYLEAHGVYPEFNDGVFLMFYLSPCTKTGELKKLGRLLKKLPRGDMPQTANERFSTGKTAAWVPLLRSTGMVCAQDCGIFPPCVPLIKEGEIITEEKINRLMRAANTFGLREGEIYVYTEER